MYNPETSSHLIVNIKSTVHSRHDTVERILENYPPEHQESISAGAEASRLLINKSMGTKAIKARLLARLSTETEPHLDSNVDEQNNLQKILERESVFYRSIGKIIIEECYRPPNLVQIIGMGVLFLPERFRYEFNNPEFYPENHENHLR